MPTNAADAAKILSANFNLLDTAAHGGNPDGKASIKDLQAIANDPGLPDYMREAARIFINSPANFNAADSAKGGSGDNRITRSGLDQFAINNAALGAEKTYDPSTPAGVAQILVDYYHIFDSAHGGGNRIFGSGRGKKDNRVSKEDVKAIANDTGQPQHVRDAASALLNSPTLWGSALSNRKDKYVSFADAQAWYNKFN